MKPGRAARAAELIFYGYPRYVAGVLLLIALAINFTNVITRYVFRFSIYWADEAMVYLVLWSAAMAGIAIAWKRAHLNMDMFLDAMPERFYRIISLLSIAASIAIFLLMAFLAFRAIRFFAGTGQVSVAMGLPMTIAHAALCLGFLLAALAMITRQLIERRAPTRRELQDKLDSAI